MKPFLTAVTTLALLIATAVYADEVPSYSCNLSSIATAKTDLATSSSKTQLTQVASQVTQFLNTCRASVIPRTATPKDQIEDFYSLVDQLMQAQMKTNNSTDCIKLGLATTDTWNSPYKTIKGSAIYSAVQQTLNTCKNKRDKAIATGFATDKCPLFGTNHKYSSAILVPKAWQLQTGGPSCLYLYGGKNRNIPEEEGIRLRENSPYLILLKMDGDKLLEQYIDFSQGELASKELCLSGRIEAVNFLASGGKKKGPLIRIQSYAEHCLRDSASFALDSVYQIDSARGLVAVDELLVSLTN